MTRSASVKLGTGDNPFTKGALCLVVLLSIQVLPSAVSERMKFLVNGRAGRPGVPPVIS